MKTSHAQEQEYHLTQGALGYHTKSDATATPKGYLISGSQNVLVNESTDKQGDVVETRLGYTLKGAASTDRNKITSEFVFKTKVGTTQMLRKDSNGDLEWFSTTSSAWETLLTGLSTTNASRFAAAWNATELLRICLFVDHSSTLYEWSGAEGTYASSTATTIVITETIATQGYLAAGTRKIRVKDSGGTWREFTYTGQSGSTFTVSSDPTAFTFTVGAVVVQSVRENANTPASGFTNDVIKTLENHVFVGSHSSQRVYMSKSTDYTSFTFSSPRVPTEGWLFTIDDFCIGFETNLAGEGKESMVMFAGNDWIYRVEFNQLGDTTIQETLRVKPIIVSSGQGAISQELIAKVKNSIVFLNKYNELIELGSVENLSTIQQVPLSDTIKPDFLAADFTGGAIRFWRNNLYITAAITGYTFILAFRGDERRFWQPPQILPIGLMSDYDGDLIGHSNALTESYVMFDGLNDNSKPIAFKAHFAYSTYGEREKLKDFDRYFTEMYVTSNASVVLKLIYEYLGAKSIQEFTYTGTDSSHLFVPNESAALGVNSLGTMPLGAVLTEPTTFLKYRRFQPVRPVDFYEMQTRYECSELDARFKILAHGPNAKFSTNAPVAITR